MATDAIVLRSGLRSRSGLRWPLSEPKTLFLGLLLAYFGSACYLDLVANVIQGDAFARVAIAQRILFSRDPHLGAIGFVWLPLPVLAIVPLVPLKFIWPQLTALGLAGGVVSSVSMAAAAVQVRGILADLGHSRATVLVLTGAFAVHPLIFFFGANGMSEAMMLLFLLITVRYLARWLKNSDLSSLAVTGMALALAYLTRYEALAAAVSVVGLVSLSSFLRARREARPFSSVLCDVLIVAGPVAVTFALWAFVSWLITGNPFQQVSSNYENRDKVPSGYVPWSGSLTSLIVTQLVSIEPLVVVLVIVRLLWVPRRHLNLVLATIACLGSTLAFMTLAKMNQSITNELRYFIALVPMAVLLAGSCLPGRSRQRSNRVGAQKLVTVVCLLAVFVALPVSAEGMLSAYNNPVAATGLQFLVAPNATNAQANQLNWLGSRQVAADLDRLHLKEGAVLLDDFLGFPIVLASDNPKQFVITSDRDFQAVLADPRGTGVQYILVPEPGYLGDLDAVNRQYPGFYENGGGFATLVKEYVQQGSAPTTFRLYKIT